MRRMLGGQGRALSAASSRFDPHNIFVGERASSTPLHPDARGGFPASPDVDIGTCSHIWTLEHDPNDPAHGTRGGRDRRPRLDRLAVTVLPGVTVGRAVVAPDPVSRRRQPLSIVVACPRVRSAGATTP